MRWGLLSAVALVAAGNAVAAETPAPGRFPIFSAIGELFPPIWQEENGEKSKNGKKAEDGGDEDGAPDEDEDERSAPAGGAASISGEGNGNGKEEGWTVKAKLNRALLPWNDGKSATYFVDSDQDASGFEIERKFKLNGGWEMMLKLGSDVVYAPSDTVDQKDRSGVGGAIKIGDALIELAHKTYGKLVLGHYDSSSDNINKMNLSGSSVLADPEVEQWNGNFFLRMAGFGLADGNGKRTEMRWGDFVNVPLGGRTGRFVTYVTPKVMGFQASASVGQPEDIEFHQDRKGFTDRTGGFAQDAALRYRSRWDQFVVTGGIGVWRDTAEEDLADEPTDDIGWGGSLAVYHVPTGLNLAFNWGNEQHTKNCASPGEITGKCRGDDRFYYVKGGLVREDILPTWGPTAFYVEYLRNWRAQHDSDDALMRTIELNRREGRELNGSKGSVWGFGVVQTLKPSRDRNFITDFYAGYRRYSVDLDLLGDSGPVATRNVRDFNVVMAGIRLRFGDRFKPAHADED